MKGKKVLVLGLAKSGAAAARLLQRLGAEVTINDAKPLEENEQAQRLDKENTTPESITLQETFHRMVKEQVDVAFMEVSSHALDYGRVHGCDFNIGVFTNLTPDHLDGKQVISQEPAIEKGLLKGERVFLRTDDDSYEIPNMVDWSSRDVLRLADVLDITANLFGQGYVTGQDVSEGDRVVPVVRIITRYGEEKFAKQIGRAHV